MRSRTARAAPGRRPPSSPQPRLPRLRSRSAVPGVLSGRIRNLPRSAGDYTPPESVKTARPRRVRRSVTHQDLRPPATDMVKSRRCSIRCRSSWACATCAPGPTSSSFPSSPGPRWSGVCVGVAALIVILSVMNGFEGELRERLLSLSAQVRVGAAHAQRAGAAPAPDSGSAAAQAWRALARSRRRRPLRRAAGARRAHSRRCCRWCCAASIPRPSPPSASWSAAITQGKLADLTAGSDSVIIGEVIAERLGLSPGDSLTAAHSRPSTAGGAPTPRLREFTVAGVFEVGLAGPRRHAGVRQHRRRARARLRPATAEQGLRVRCRDVLAAPARRRAAARAAAARTSR